MNFFSSMENGSSCSRMPSDWQDRGGRLRALGHQQVAAEGGVGAGQAVLRGHLGHHARRR